MSINSYVATLKKKLQVAMEQLGRDSVDRVQQELSSPGPSSPGSPPGLQTGHLRDSQYYNVVDGNKTVELHVGNSAKYAVHLEYGTSKMSARPFLRPELMQLQKDLPKYIRGK